jgi:hypothetical protein
LTPSKGAVIAIWQRASMPKVMNILSDMMDGEMFDGEVGERIITEGVGYLYLLLDFEFQFYSLFSNVAYSFVRTYFEGNLFLLCVESTKQEHV